MFAVLDLPRAWQDVTRRFAFWVRQHGLGTWLLAGPVVLFLAGTLIFPLLLVLELSLYQRGPAGVIIEVVSLENYLRFFSDTVYVRILVNSAILGALACALTVLVAYIPACVLGLTRSSLRNTLLLLVLVPFWISFIVRTYAWVIMLGTNGVVNGAAQSLGLSSSPWSMLYGKGAVILGLVHAMLPFAIVPIYAAVERIDDAILEAASTLGARPFAVFREIIVPVSLPGVVAASMLVFIDATGAFITPQLLGGPRDMMIAQLVQERFLASYDWPFGAAVSFIYLAFTGILFALFTWLRSALRRSM
jgi:spermidine/putrescine transport system permease protein